MKTKRFLAAAVMALAILAAAFAPPAATAADAQTGNEYEAASITDANNVTGPAYAAGAGIIYNGWETAAVGVAWMKKYTSTSVQHGVRFSLSEPLVLGDYAASGAVRFRLNFYTENNTGGGTGLGDVILHVSEGGEETLYRTSSTADFYRKADALDKTNVIDAAVQGTSIFTDADGSWIYAKKRNGQFYSHAYYKQDSGETNDTVKGDPWQTDVYDGEYVIPLSAFTGLSADHRITAVSITNVSNYMYTFNYNIGEISIGKLSPEAGSFGWSDGQLLFEPGIGAFEKFTTGTAAADETALTYYHAELVNAGSILFADEATGWDTLGVRLPEELTEGGTADLSGIAGIVFDIAYEGTSRPYFNWQLYNSSVPDLVNSNNYRWQWLDAAEYYYKADGDITVSHGRNLEKTSFDGLIYDPFDAGNFGDAGSSAGTNPFTAGETAKPFITLIFNGDTNAGREFRLRGIRFITDDDLFFDTAAVTVTGGSDWHGRVDVSVAGSEAQLEAGGTINGSMRYYDNITVDYEADEGYFVRIKANGAEVSLADSQSGTAILSYDNPELLDMELNVVVSIEFVALLRIEHSANGQGEIATDKNYYSVGDTAQITLTPATGWETGPIECSAGYTVNGTVISVVMEENVSLTVNFSPVEYTITYELDGGVNSSENPTSYTILDEVTFAAPAKDGWAFAYWLDGSDERTDGIEKGSTGDITVRAVYTQLPAPTPSDENEDDGTAGTADGGGCAGFAGGGASAAAIPALAAFALIGLRRKRGQ